MNQQILDRTLALAGVIQAAHLVNEVANTGTLPANYYEATLASVLNVNPTSTLDVYGGKDNVILGLKTLDELLQFNQNPMLMPVVRYSLSLLHLERKLANSLSKLNQMREKLQQIKSQVDYFSLTDERVLASLATLYQETISTFSMRIKVTGNPIHLQKPEVANQIRALLLCGIRSAFLWQQLGGRRWRLFFELGNTADAIDYWLNH